MNRAPEVYAAVMDPDTSLHYVAAIIRHDIDAYRSIAGFDISGNPGITATLYNTGSAIARARALAEENRTRRLVGIPFVLYPQRELTTAGWSTPTSTSCASCCEAVPRRPRSARPPDAHVERAGAAVGGGRPRRSRPRTAASSAEREPHAAPRRRSTPRSLPPVAVLAVGRPLPVTTSAMPGAACPRFACKRRSRPCVGRLGHAVQVDVASSGVGDGGEAARRAPRSIGLSAGGWRGGDGFPTRFAASPATVAAAPSPAASRGSPRALPVPAGRGPERGDRFGHLPPPPRARPGSALPVRLAAHGAASSRHQDDETTAGVHRPRNRGRRHPRCRRRCRRGPARRWPNRCPEQSSADETGPAAPPHPADRPAAAPSRSIPGCERGACKVRSTARLRPGR